MSGAPVLAVANGIYESRAGAMRSGFVLKLLGIFSSMPVARQTRSGDPASGGADPPQTVDTPLQLGFVWKARVIAEMARAYRPRRQP
jgi:hypothetical protein